MEILTIVGVVASVVFGLAGFVIGLVSLGQSRKAGDAAVASNLLAAEANEIARAVASRDEEIHDVAWEWNWDKQLHDMVQVQNISKYVANEAIVQFFYENNVEAAGPMPIADRETIRLQIPGLLDDICAERRRLSEFVAETTRPDFMGNIPWLPREVRVRLRATWKTDASLGKSFDSGWLTERLPLD